MWNLLKSELLKLRRCQILLVGLVALALCPLVQYGSQLIVEAEYRNPNYDFSALFENVVPDVFLYVIVRSIFVSVKKSIYNVPSFVTLKEYPLLPPAKIVTVSLTKVSLSAAFALFTAPGHTTIKVSTKSAATNFLNVFFIEDLAFVK